MSTVNPQQLAVLGTAFLASHSRLLVKGAPGIGKTEIVEGDIAAPAGAKLVLMHPSVGEPTDFKGAPWVVQTANGPRAEFLPFGQLREVDEATSLTLVFIDDLGQALPATQAGVMQMLDRYRGNPNVVFFAATNDRKHRANVQGLLEPVKSRFDSIVELVTDAKSWAMWAQRKMIDPRLVAYLRDKQPDALHKFEPSADIVNQPCPRTWNSVNKILGMNLDNDMRFLAMMGAVGQPAALGFNGYLKMVEECPTPEEIFNDPMGTPIPKKLDLVYAVCTSVAYYATEKEFASVVKYGIRMYEDPDATDMSAIMVSDVYRKIGRALMKHPAFAKLAAHPLGDLVVQAANLSDSMKKAA